MSELGVTFAVISRRLFVISIVLVIIIIDLPFQLTIFSENAQDCFQRQSIEKNGLDIYELFHNLLHWSRNLNW